MITYHINILVWLIIINMPYIRIIYHNVHYKLMLRICMVLLILLVFSIPALADDAGDAGDKSMDVQDIMDVEPALPFGGGLFSMIFGLIKWGAIAGFIIGLFVIVAAGSIATAMDNADLSEKSQDNLFMLVRIIMLAAAVYLLGSYVFKTYL